jgi:hypothetical protein
VQYAAMLVEVVFQYAAQHSVMPDVSYDCLHSVVLVMSIMAQILPVNG